MPNQANITVKKNDGTTDVLYTGVQPASGSVPAIWRAPTTTSAAHAAELRISSRDAMKGKNREIKGTFQFPQVALNSTTNVTSVIHRAKMMVIGDFPKEMSQAAIDEYVSQFFNLGASQHVKDQFKAGFASS